MQRRPRHLVPDGRPRPHSPRTAPPGPRPTAAQQPTTQPAPSRLPDPQQRPTEASTNQDRRIRPTLSRITWRRTVAHHPTQDREGRRPLPNLPLFQTRARLAAGRRRRAELALERASGGRDLGSGGSHLAPRRCRPAFRSRTRTRPRAGTRSHSRRGLVLPHVVGRG